MPWVRPDIREISDEDAKELASKRMNICDEENNELREVLLDMSSQSAKWILGTFLPQENVKVSSPSYFKELLQSWYKDPCSMKKPP